MGAKERTQCYFDVEINREPVGRIVFQLFSDICPKTCKNFLCLCTGEKGSGKTTKKKLCYKGSTFHRVVKNFMIQGGDFTEGNGRGGESIYGGFFEDENFTLKHDKAFLLSMANRGKDTNGSQFFITTKTAPHLDGVHVVFGLVISGFEVIKNIERLKTDTASRPYADVRVIDCGQLITKSANDVLQGKKSQTFDSEEDSSSSSESESEFDKKLASQKRKRRSKNKYNKRKRLQRAKESTTFDTTEDESHGKMEMEEEDEGNKNMKREKPVVRPEEIPPVPENRFLLRQDLPIQEDKIKVAAQDIIMAPNDPKPAVTKSGRKIKGRGTMRYHTPTRSQSFSESEGERGSSETPPHWKEEMQKTRVYQPPSLERWSKGEKWDDSSNTPRSRSRNDSVSEASICSHGHQSRKGKKKAKSKKSSKKQKHSKKQKLLKPKENSLSEGEMSGSSDASRKRKKTKFSRYSESSRSRFYSNSRSLSPRSQRSLNSERRYYSSRSIRNSRSYSRSWTRSYSRSRSRSKRHFRYQYRRSLAHSRSLSPSQSRYRTRSSTRSTSRYRSTTPLRSSKKKMLRSSQKSKPIEDCPKISPVFVPEESAGRVLVPNSGSVAPLPFSDSPPPSRWKPGIKPWKPTCLPKVNVNTDLVLLTNIPSESTLLETPPIIDQCCNQLKSYTPVALPTPIDTYPNVTSYWPRCSRNSQSHSRSSFSRSNSYDSGKRATKKKKKKKKKHSGSHRTSHKRQKNHRGKLASPQSPVHRPKGLLVKEDKLDSLSELQTMTSKSLCVKGSVVNKNPAEWECEEGTLIKTASELPVEEKERASDWRKRNVLSRCWESESDTEDPDTFLETKLLSEKEEGEASSENDDFWPVLQSKNDVEVKDLSRVGKDCDADTKNLKHKSKKAKRKHKRKKRNSSKSGSHRSKSKKLKKPQKPKEAFHWQPPLEFGEEGEEDESVAQSKPLNNSKLTSVNDGADKHLQARLVKTQGTESKDHDQVIHKSPKGKCSQVASKDVEKQKISEGKKSTVNRLNKTEIQPVEGRPGSNTSNLSDTKSTNTLFMNVDQTMTGPKQNSRLQQRQSKEKPALPTKNVFQCSNEPSQPQGEKSSPFSGTPALSPVIRPEVMPGESCFQALDKKWKPLRDMSIMQAVLPKPLNLKVNKTEYQTKSKGLKIEIKGRNRIRPGSLFDEVRKTARLNQRTRNQDSSSEEDSPPATDERSRSHNRSKSRSVSSDRSYNDSRSWSRSYTNTSRSSSRSRSRYSWRHSRSRSRSYRSRSRRRHRRRYRSRSDSDYSYSSRSRSYGRRSGSSDHSTRSYRSYSRSSSRRRSRSSRYS